MLLGASRSIVRLECYHVYNRKTIEIRNASFVTSTQGHEFRKLSIDQWRDVTIQKRFTDWVSKQLNINKPSDWYRVTSSDLMHLGGNKLISNVYHGSLVNLLSVAYPNTKWSQSDFIFPEQQTLEQMAKIFNIKEMTDWYKVTTRDFQKHSSSLFVKYNSSRYLLLKSAYPNFDWEPWKFSKSVNNWDSDTNLIRKFMESVAKQLNVKEMSDWYNDLTKVRGHFNLSSQYSVAELLAISFPEYDWLPWKFARCPNSFWDDVKNQRKFMEWAGRELGIKEMSDWYKVSNQQLCKIEGRSILSKHNDSLSQLLPQVFPEFEWNKWQFEKAPNNIWKDPHTLRSMLDKVAKKLGVNEYTDWYNVQIKTKDVNQFGFNFKAYMLPQMLSLAYPEHEWSFKDKTANAFTKKSQFMLKSCLKTLFPKEEILEDYRPSDLASSEGRFLELDFFYPKFKLAVEYQGEQHYKNVNLFHRAADTLSDNKRRDMQKLDLCKKQGISLVQVPYWWDRSLDSLEATIYNQRPDLFAQKPKGNPIPIDPPSQKQLEMDKKTAKILMTATEWENESMEPTGWLMSEKYDGMRLYWNGSNLYTRQGKKVKAPSFFTSQLPGIALDGELWTRYGLYQEVVNLVNVQDAEKWNKATFWVFDAPDVGNKPYEERVEYLKEMKDKGSLPSFVNIVETVKCTGKQHLQEYFDSIVAKGGEGVILRESQSLYKPGRSKSLRKFKEFFDTEVKVMENNYPHGFLCLQTNGKSIFVNIKNENSEEARKVKEGSVITVKYLGTNTYGTLQYPYFYRERTDIKFK